MLEVVGETEPPKYDKPLDKLFLNPDKETAALMKLAAEQGEDGIVTQEMLDKLPFESRAVVAAILQRGKVGQGAAREHIASLSQRERELERREVALAAQRQDLFKWASDPRVKEFLESKAAGDQPDPETPEGQKWAAQNEAKEILQGFLGTISQIEADQAALVEQARQQTEYQARLDSIKTYADANRDDFFMANEEGVEVLNPVVFGKIKEFMGAGLPIERAHKLAMIELDMEADDADQRYEESRARARDRSRRPPGRTIVPDTPSDLSGVQLMEWYDRHPEARERDMADFNRRGVGYGSGRYPPPEESP